MNPAQPCHTGLPYNPATLPCHTALPHNPPTQPCYTAPPHCPTTHPAMLPRHTVLPHSSAMWVSTGHLSFKCQARGLSRSTLLNPWTTFYLLAILDLKPPESPAPSNPKHLHHHLLQDVHTLQEGGAEGHTLFVNCSTKGLASRTLGL